MYLKRLELKGFKSFPTKTDIEFKEGITAIVGPNGSGKSNISDAVRWVLGEQSIKSLRGDKLEDVIFAGTDTKKPMNYCEVALTIDNSDSKLNIDFSEVTIKRRAYRSGESEFFLNNKSCRLKDIKEILLDTGIGKDGYSIIEQGKVDEILSNNPINRRKVFDEACGISKFRYKKQEAERNLKNTKENLERIDDIYVEIENQLKPLFSQQNKAIKYLELSEKLRHIEVNSYIKEVEEIERELKEVNEHSTVLEEQAKEMESEKSSIEANYNETNSQIEDMNSNIEKSVEYINTIKGVISKKDSQISVLNERIKNCVNDIERKHREIDEIKESIKNNNINLDELQKDKVSKEKNIESTRLYLESKESENKDIKSELEDTNKRIEVLKDEIINLLDKKQEANGKLSTLTANTENINSRRNNINTEINEIKNIRLKKDEENQNLKNIINDYNEELKELKMKEVNLNNELNSLISKNNELDKAIIDSKYKLNDYNSKLNIYVDMENHYEGFNKGVKEVLKNKNLKGVDGALGQVLEVPLKYEKAIEAALGAYLQNIITVDEESAKVAINYLKKNNLGRVTFLPMNVIKSNKIDNKSINKKTNFIGIASDLISYNEKYKNIIENVLGRTIIIEDIDKAIAFARENSHRFKVVTLEGEILNPGGSLTGGSLRTNGNILSRKRLINECRDNIDKLKVQISNFIQNKNEIVSRSENVKQSTTLVMESIKTLDKKIIIENSNINRINEEIKNLDISINKLAVEQQGLGSNLDYTLDKTKAIKSEMLNIENEYNENKSNIEELSTTLKELENKYGKEKQVYDESNLLLAKDSQIYEGISKDISRITNEVEALKNKEKEIKQSMELQEGERVQLEEEIVIEKSEKVNLEKQLVDNKRSLENKQVARDDLKSKIDEMNKAKKILDRKYMDIKESLFKVENKLERLKSTKEEYTNKLFEKYEMTIIEAMEIKDNSIVVDKKLLEALRKEIRSLGNVNLDSIKEYEEVKERYDFYSEQKLDLEESIDVIEKLISELEENMKSEFEVNFNKINENFKYVYKRLFGGGYGELTILDKENILESDIEITAQPPGKKMKNLSLLSGGEKALTAISILFSIILAKPTPFCILDEIEAPLDDANIFRFGEFLKELAKDTQFISVTHRRGTMEASDYIYGVTMQEKAISKVLSLKLKEAEQMTDII